MKNYIDEVPTKVKEYYKILSNEFPSFLNEYIYTKEMRQIDGVNQICGEYWRKENIYEDIYSVLRHSVGVALIIWNFTHDKKQTLAGLFHDIASPAFKHCLDFLRGDSEKQETLENETPKMIKNSPEIMDLLKRDNIKLEEVSNYKIYPIADNETPKLSADRLEYTFMNGTYYKKVWDLDTIQKIYNDIKIMQNEENIQELGFKSKEMAERFIEGAKELWPLWVSPEDTITIYGFADILKLMSEEKYIKIEDLYKLTEQEVINLIRNCKDKKISIAFERLMNFSNVIECDEYREDKFCVSRKIKKRYINPLTTEGRIYDISEIAKKHIYDYINMKKSKYVCIEKLY